MHRVLTKEDPGASRLVVIIVGAVVALLVAVVAGPFIYIHFIEGKAPAPLTLSSSGTTTPATATPATAAGATAASSGTIDGSWSVAGGSTAGYRIKEVLFGQSATAVGRTNSVTGTFTIQGSDVTAGSFSVDLTTVSSGKSQRDGQFQGRIMDTASFPTATFKLTQPIHLGTVPADGATVTANATGDLGVHGVTKSVTFPVTAKRSGGAVQVAGSVPITFADFNISNPSGGPATTEDHGTMEFLLNFIHA